MILESYYRRNVYFDIRHVKQECKYVLTFYNRRAGIDGVEHVGEDEEESDQQTWG